MRSVEHHPPQSLGLWGDGDEIAAISAVERHFGVRLDYSDAQRWVTADDVFRSLQKALPAEKAIAPETWTNFAIAISSETGVDPAEVKTDTRLLGTARFGWRLFVTFSVAAGAALALIHHR